MANLFGENRLPQYTFFATRVNGRANGTSLTALSNTTSSAAGRLRGISGLEMVRPEGATVAVNGDNGLLYSFDQQPQDPMSGNVTVNLFDRTFYNLAASITPETIGAYNVVTERQCVKQNAMFIITNTPSVDFSTGAPVSGWTVTEYYNVRFQYLGKAYTEGAATPVPYKMVADPSATNITGATFTSPVVRNSYFSTYPVTAITYRGDGTSSQQIALPTAYPLAVASADAIQAAINNTPATYTTDFTGDVANNRINMVGTLPAAGADIVLRFQFLPSGC